MNHLHGATINKVTAKSHLADNLPAIIQALDSELALLDKHVEQARGLADHLHGSQPRDASVSGAPSEPGAVLARLRDRLNRFESLNAALTTELGRLSSGL
jgi:hypothetical protein